MPLATAATGIGKQVVTHVWCTWSGARRERAARDAKLIDLVRLSARDHFQQRRWVRQLEDLADQIAERLRPVHEHERSNLLDDVQHRTCLHRVQPKIRVKWTVNLFGRTS